MPFGSNRRGAAAGLIVVAIAAARTASRAAGRRSLRARSEIAGARDGLTDAVVYGRLAVQAFWLVGVALIGMLPALGLFMLLYMAVEGRTRAGTALLIALPLWIDMYVPFVKLLHVPWPPSLLGDALPWLRAASGRLI